MTPAPIDTAAVGTAVEAHGLDWLYFESTGSTNADALRHHESAGREAVVFADAQTGGRGRRGRRWHSPPGHNLYCTVGLARSLPAKRRGLLSIVTGLALCRALDPLLGGKLALKWPNDLLGDGRKLGGILIESRPLDDPRAFFAIGFGINLRLDGDALAAIDTPATSLAQLAGNLPDRSALLVACIDAVVTAVRGLDHDAVDELIAEFASRDAYRDCEVEIHTPAGVRGGINRGIAPGGELRVETADGVELHAAAEISLRPVPA